MAGVAVGLDFASIMAIGAAQGADAELLADVLPDVEGSIVAAMNGEPDEE